MDFTGRIESLKHEEATWEQFAQQAQRPQEKNRHRGSAEAARKIKAFFMTIQDADPTTQARKLYAYKNTEPTAKPEEDNYFNTGYLAKLNVLSERFDMVCDEIYRDVHGLKSLRCGPHIHAWLKGEE